ncbi:hypothetical protein X943_003957 [Babesia divergens]|uniref:Uncharacterized protein n=1 Tax=Babesia divergens TaxID=32595 RepID=A0AAD9G804_BABDI|nr:hypothetical protein X943_003957 [Babesia divergens]
MWRGQSLTVEEAIAFIRDKFEDMGNDLALVEIKLISELGNVYGTNIFNLHTKCQNVKNQIRKMINSLVELYEARKQLMAAIQGQINMSASLKNIEKMLGPHVHANEDTQLLERLATHYMNIWNCTEADLDYNDDVEVSRVLTPLAAIGLISQKQFDEIPALVKRRAKLEQVNELYRFLFDIAVERKKYGRHPNLRTNRCHLICKESHTKTGTSKLAALRYIKLAEINNRDETITLLDDRFAFTHNKTRHTIRM